MCSWTQEFICQLNYCFIFSKIDAAFQKISGKLCFIQEIKELGCKAGVVLNPGTSPEAIKSLLPFIDMVLVMTVNPGFSGQKFIPQMLEKIKTIRQLIDLSNSPALLQVDGGINLDTVKSVIDAGADVIVAATAIYKFPDGIKAGVDALRNY